MYSGSLEHSKIIAAVQEACPDAYVRDHRDNNGFLTICRGYQDIRWKDQLTGGKVYRQVPLTTLMSIPRGNVTSATIYHGLRLHRPGWREQFRKAAKNFTDSQRRKIEKSLGIKVFPEGV